MDRISPDTCIGVPARWMEFATQRTQAIAGVHIPSELQCVALHDAMSATVSAATNGPARRLLVLSGW